MKAPNAGSDSPFEVRVNGAFLSQYHGKPVCLLGTILKADGGGTSFQVKSSDGQTINVRLKAPINEPLDGMVEIYGIGQGRNLILAETFTVFPSQIAANFDMNAYNEAIALSQQVPSCPWVHSS